MDESVCPECGARIDGNHNECRALWDEFSVRLLADSRLAPLRDMAFDAYCMQHVARYCVSAKSYMAHLTRLCCWLEYQGNARGPSVLRVLEAIRSSLDGPIRLPRPDPPEPHWTITIADIAAVKDVETCQRQILAWAEDVWETYVDQHAPAREWIRVHLLRH